MAIDSSLSVFLWESESLSVFLLQETFQAWVIDTSIMMKGMMKAYIEIIMKVVSTGLKEWLFLNVPAQTWCCDEACFDTFQRWSTGSCHHSWMHMLTGTLDEACSHVSWHTPPHHITDGLLSSFMRALSCVPQPSSPFLSQQAISALLHRMSRINIEIIPLVQLEWVFAIYIALTHRYTAKIWYGMAQNMPSHTASHQRTQHALSCAEISSRFHPEAWLRVQRFPW